MKVILDTNLLISALISPRGIPDRLYRAWRDGRFALVTSIEQLEEFRRATRYPRVRKYLAPAAAGAMHNDLRHLAEVVTDLPPIDMSPDPCDNFLLATAVVSNADFLATGDKSDLLSLKRFGRTQIVTARTLAAQLKIAPRTRTRRRASQ